MLKRIGIITSGGDCGGLNAAIKGAAQMANSCGLEAFIISNGYAGLYNLVERDSLVKLDESKADSISSYRAGSAAGNSRVKITKIDDPDKYDKIKAGLEKFSIDALVIAGGDDTGSVVVDLCKNGIPCIHVPKTMDIDLHTYSVGGDSAVSRISRFIEEVKTTGISHNRVIVVEVFGRYAGHTTFLGGIGGDADCILIPEVPVDFEVVYKHLKKTFFRRIKESPTKTATYIIVAAEGMKDATGEVLSDGSVKVDSFGHKKLGGAGKYVRQKIEELIKNDGEVAKFMKEQALFVEKMNAAPQVREVVPGYLIRSGYTSSLDVNFGKNVGAGAVLLLVSGITGVTVTGVVDGKVNYMATEEAIKQRFVSEQMIRFYEKMGVCLGRKPVSYEADFSEVKETWCYL